MQSADQYYDKASHILAATNKAIDYLNKALELDPNHVKSYNLKAWLQDKEGKKQEARSDWIL